MSIFKSLFCEIITAILSDNVSHKSNDQLNYLSGLCHMFIDNKIIGYDLVEIDLFRRVFSGYAIVENPLTSSNYYAVKEYIDGLHNVAIETAQKYVDFCDL
jgi:hypothetical protein